MSRDSFRSFGPGINLISYNEHIKKLDQFTEYNNFFQKSKTVERSGTIILKCVLGYRAFVLHVQRGRIRDAERHPELRPALPVRVDGGQVLRPRRTHLLRHQ